MKGLLTGYGRGLTAAFFLAAALWGMLLIILPQLTMLERSLTTPKRAFDSSVAQTLANDASICISTLQLHADDAAPEAATGGLAVPSAGGMGVPSLSGATTGGETTGATRPYILQCDRATTHVALVRGQDGVPAWLDTAYDLPRLAVSEADPIADQIATAKEIEALARKAFTEIRAVEIGARPWTFENFAILAAPRMIPLGAEQKAIEDAKLSKKLMGLAGLRFERDGQTWERIGLITLTRTILYAVAATGLALIVCYPIAYKVALATPPGRAVWLFTGLVIPYAIVELMRIYAWTTIIDNQGVINSVLMWSGLTDDPVQLKRSPLTVFVVIVYTYVLFMVFPIFNVMSTLDRNQIEAARDLGAKPWRVHARIVIPHAKPGIAVGAIATFMLAAGAFSVPRIISRGLQSEWFAQTIYNKFFESENSNVGAAYSFAYTLICFALVAFFMWAMRTRLKDFARLA
jgi:spermidine/putrescine transport system permease protein